MLPSPLQFAGKIAELRRSAGGASRVVELHSRLTELTSSTPVLTVVAACLLDIGNLDAASQLLDQIVQPERNDYVQNVRTRLERLQHERTNRDLRPVQSPSVGFIPRTINQPVTPSQSATSAQEPSVQRGRLSKPKPEPDFISVAGSANLRIRRITSKGQLDRAAHHLRNCLSSYWSSVRDQRRVILTVERNGQPIQAIEIDPRSGNVIQWKGHRNTVPDPELVPTIARALSNSGYSIPLKFTSSERRASVWQPLNHQNCEDVAVF